MDKGTLFLFLFFSFGGVLTLTWLCCCCCCIGLTITAERRHCVLQAIKHHPDKHPNDPAAHDRFLEYTRAYEVLKDPDGTFAFLLCTANPCQAVQHGIACIATIYIRYFLPCSSYLFLFSSSSFFFSLFFSFLFFSFLFFSFFSLVRKKYDRLGKEGLEEDEKNGGGGGGGRGGGWHDSRYYEREFGLYDEDEQIDTMTSQDFWPVTVAVSVTI